MNWLVSATLVFGSPLYNSEDDLKTKVKALSHHLSPAPGQEIRVDPREKKDPAGRDLMPLRGYIMVRPPSGTCFIVQRGLHTPDVNVCKPTSLSFELSDLDDAGRINWRITTQKNEAPVLVTWPTPHRLGTMIPAGEWSGQDYQLIVLDECRIEKRAPRPRIEVRLMNGDGFVINFPPEDKLLPQPAEMPNLVVPRDPDADAALAQKLGTKPAAGDNKQPAEKGHDDHGKAKPEANAHADGHGKEGAKAEPLPKKKKKNPATTFDDTTDPIQKWILKPRDTYVMPSSAILKEGSPAGIRGECRYRLKDAPGDPESGVIECFITETWDYLRITLPCTKGM